MDQWCRGSKIFWRFTVDLLWFGRLDIWEQLQARLTAYGISLCHPAQPDCVARWQRESISAFLVDLGAEVHQSFGCSAETPPSLPVIAYVDQRAESIGRLNGLLSNQLVIGVIGEGVTDSGLEIARLLATTKVNSLSFCCTHELVQQLNGAPQLLLTAIRQTFRQPDAFATVDAVARHASMSRRALNRLLARHGIVPNHLLRAARVARLLDVVNAAGTVQDAMQRSGISDQRSVRRYLQSIFTKSNLDCVIQQPRRTLVSQVLQSCRQT
jgi:DNA-binding phage protein